MRISSFVALVNLTMSLAVAAPTVATALPDKYHGPGEMSSTIDNGRYAYGYVYWVCPGVIHFRTRFSQGWRFAGARFQATYLLSDQFGAVIRSVQHLKGINATFDDGTTEEVVDSQLDVSHDEWEAVAKIGFAGGYYTQPRPPVHASPGCYPGPCDQTGHLSDGSLAISVLIPTGTPLTAIIVQVDGGSPPPPPRLPSSITVLHPVM